MARERYTACVRKQKKKTHTQGDSKTKTKNQEIRRTQIIDDQSSARRGAVNLSFIDRTAVIAREGRAHVLGAGI